MGESTGESSMIRTYLDWLIAVPWSKRCDDQLYPVHAREVLDTDHAGLDDVKERITEYLAVRKLRAFFFSSRRRHTRFDCDWSSDVCSSDLLASRTRLVRTAAAASSVA